MPQTLRNPRRERPFLNLKKNSISLNLEISSCRLLGSVLEGLLSQGLDVFAVRGFLPIFGFMVLVRGKESRRERKSCSLSLRVIEGAK